MGNTKDEERMTNLGFARTKYEGGSTKYRGTKVLCSRLKLKCQCTNL